MLTLCYSNFETECGVDEAGRGCLAGPVVAAAVINPNKSSFKNSSELEIKYHTLINDSKVISENKRKLLKPIIEELSLSFAISFIEPKIIDEINILNASILAMQNSILNLKIKPVYIIVDGNRFSEIKPIAFQKHINPKNGIFNGIPYQTIVKGDSKYLSIAAASILAKTHRDEYMDKIHEEFPMYNWKKNKGYPTKEHREAILKFGITKYHRVSFKFLTPALAKEESEKLLTDFVLKNK